jgi:hypothetical protein
METSATLGLNILIGHNGYNQLVTALDISGNGMWNAAMTSVNLAGKLMEAFKHQCIGSNNES